MKNLRLYDYLFGYCDVVCEARSAERVINAVMNRTLRHGAFERARDGTLRFRISRKDEPLYREILDKNGFVGYSLYRRGLPFLLYRYRRRVGFFAGMLIFLAIAYISTLFVWRVEVTSDTTLNKTTVESQLADIGVRAGTFIPKCDFWDLSAKYLTTYDDCSWLSINMSGTVAEIELRERLSHSAVGVDLPCNIIAREGGVIDSFVINSGRGYVTEGTTVQAGDLLVSGVIEDKQGSVILKGADAEVYAEVGRDVAVTVPFEYEVTSYSGAEKSAYTVGFFGAEIPVPFGAEEPDGWERTVDTSAVTLPDGKPMPITLTKTTWRETLTETRARTEDEALDLARRESESAVAAQFPNARILEVAREYTSDGSSVTVVAHVRCIIDIAEKQPINLDLETGK